MAGNDVLAIVSGAGFLLVLIVGIVWLRRATRAPPEAKKRYELTFYGVIVACVFLNMGIAAVILVSQPSTASCSAGDHTSPTETDACDRGNVSTPR